MRRDIQVLDRVKSAYSSLRPSEQKVADCILNDPEGCTQYTIGELPIGYRSASLQWFALCKLWDLTDTGVLNIVCCGIAAENPVRHRILII